MRTRKVKMRDLKSGCKVRIPSYTVVITNKQDLNGLVPTDDKGINVLDCTAIGGPFRGSKGRYVALDNANVVVVLEGVDWSGIGNKIADVLFPSRWVKGMVKSYNKAKASAVKRDEVARLSGVAEYQRKVVNERNFFHDKKPTTKK